MAYANSNRILTIASFGGTSGADNINIIGPYPEPPGERPNGGDLVVGDIWFDGDIIWIWNGTEWVQMTPNVPVQMFGSKSPSLRPDGTPLKTADRWYNTSTSVEYVFRSFEDEEPVVLSSEYGSSILTFGDVEIVADVSKPESLPIATSVGLMSNEEEIIIVSDSIGGRWLPVYSEEDALLVN